MSRENKQPHLVLHCRNEKLDLIIGKIKDLTKISDVVVMKINSDNVLFYSFIANGNDISAFKYYSFKTSDLFTIDDVDKICGINYTVVLTKAKNTATAMSNFLTYPDVTFKLYYNENDDNFINTFTIENKLLAYLDCGMSHLLKTKKADFNYDLKTILKMINTKDVLFSFKLTKDDFDKIKKQAGLEKEASKEDKFLPLYIEIDNNVIYVKESKWSLPVGENLTLENDIFSTPKKYFSCINYVKGEKEMEVFVKDAYLYIIGEETNLVIATELSA